MAPKHARAVLSSDHGCQAHPSNDVERNVQKQRWGCVFQCCRIRRSLLAQRFWELSGSQSRPSSYFERPMAAEHTRSMISSRMCERTTLRQRFRMMSKNTYCILISCPTRGQRRPIEICVYSHVCSFQKRVQKAARKTVTGNAPRKSGNCWPDNNKGRKPMTL